MRRVGVYCAAPLRLVKVEKNLLEITFISLSARVITRMSSETLPRTLKTPSGKEMSLQFDRSADKKRIIIGWQRVVCRPLLVQLDITPTVLNEDFIYVLKLQELNKVKHGGNLT